MKRVASGVALGILLAGAGWFFWGRAPQHPTAAAYLPATTLLYVELPDAHRTWLHYQGSKLRQIVEQPEIKALASAAPAPLAKIAATWGESAGSGSFVAVTQCAWTPEAGQSKTIEPKEIAESLGGIAGFYRSPDGGKHVDEWVRQLADGGAPAMATHGSVSYAAYDLPQWGVRLCRARWGDWDLVSLGEPALFDFLDRAAAPISPGSLRDAPDYASVLKRVDPDADIFLYSNTHETLALYGKILAATTPTLNPAMLAQWGFMHGSAMSFSLRRDAVAMRSAVAAPQAERGPLAASFAPLPLASLRFTTPSTVFYLAENVNWEQIYDQQTMRAMQPAGTSLGANPLEAMEKQVQAQGLDLHENFLRAIGPEMAVVADWPAGQEVPDLLLLFAVRDPAKFSPFYDKYSRMLTPLLAIAGASQPFAAGEFQGVSVTPRQMSRISPTLFDGPSFWGLSLTASGAQRLLASQKGTLTPRSFEGSGSPALPGQPYCTLYLKTSELAGRGYTAARPLLAQFLGAAEAEKLPASLTAAAQFGELRMVGKSDGDFLLASIHSPDGGVGLTLGLFDAFQGSLAKLRPRPAPVSASPQ